MLLHLSGLTIKGLGLIFYTIFLGLFRVTAAVSSLFSAKARKWREGRSNIFQRLKQSIPVNENIIWMHCASLGEFEQGRPVLENIRRQYPGYKILLTFFSPSGYEIRKNYDGADWVFYLPMDSRRNARRFIEITHPALVIFVKYEFWYHYLTGVRKKNIPLLLISAAFRSHQPFFRWYGGLHRKMLHCFTHIFVQDSRSKGLLDKAGFADRSSIAGDTRFDRVSAIAGNFEPVSQIETFIDNKKAFVAGSTWPEDEKVIQKAFATITEPDIKLIIAPHEINESHIGSLLKLFPGALLFSRFNADAAKKAAVLVIDNIGMLSRLYKYAWITYVGGAMIKRGIHNVLEAAVYDKIVLFGPEYDKNPEVTELVKAGGGIPINDIQKDGQLLRQVIEVLLAGEEEYALRSKAAGDFVRDRRGATASIVHFIQEKRLLTN